MDGEEVIKMKARGIFGSLEATGKFGNIMVAFTWKGIQVIRKLVYPAQPITPLKTAQQLAMRLAQAEWHNALYTNDDNSAWVLLASTRASSETGPNQMTREYIRVARIPDTWSRLREGRDAVVGGEDRGLIVGGLAGFANMNARCGTNIRFMNTVVALVWNAPGETYAGNIPLGTFNSGDRVYYQFYDSAGVIADALGITGIYYFDMP